MNPVIRKLVVKELFINRWMIASTIIVGLISVVVSGFGKTAYSIGGLMWLTALVAFGVILAVYGIVQERKEHVLPFVLSLPISGRDYLRAKMLGLLLCYLVVWLPLATAAVIAVLSAPSLADGFLPFVVLLCVFLLANFTVVLGGMLFVPSETAQNVLIIVTNMGITLFMFGIFAIDGIRLHSAGPVPVWNSAFFTVLGCELLLITIMLCAPLLRRDHDSI